MTITGGFLRRVLAHIVLRKTRAASLSIDSTLCKAIRNVDFNLAVELHSRQQGAVAQLGERRVRNAKVRSSILLGSTNINS